MKKRPVSRLTVVVCAFGLCIGISPHTGHAASNGAHGDIRTYENTEIAIAANPRRSAAAPSSELPPVITGISAPTLLVAGDIGRWSIQAHDPAGGALSYATTWGDGGFWSIFEKPSFADSPEWTHAFSAPGMYSVSIYARNEAGKTTVAQVPVKVVPKGAASSSPAPLISDVRMVFGAGPYPSIEWATDVNADSRAWLSSSIPVSSTSSPSIIFPFLDTFHAIPLAGIATSGPTYVVVGSQDSIGRLGTSATFMLRPLSTSTGSFMWARFGF